MTLGKRSLIGIWSILILTNGCGKSASLETTVDPEARTKIAGLYTGTAVIRSAEQRLTSQCMRAAGYSFTPTSVSEDRSIPQDYSDDVERLRVDGYGLLEEQRATARLMRDEGVGSEVGVGGLGRNKALFGAPEDTVTVTVAGLVVNAPRNGCVADAQKKLYGSVETAVLHDELISNSVSLALEKAQKDPAVVDAFENWRSCMQRRGYQNLDSRNAARGLAESKYDGLTDAAAHAEEIRIATDDAECDKSVGYTPIREKADLVQLSNFLAENETLILDLLERQEVAQRIAREAMF